MYAACAVARYLRTSIAGVTPRLSEAELDELFAEARELYEHIGSMFVVRAETTDDH